MLVITVVVGFRFRFFEFGSRTPTREIGIPPPDWLGPQDQGQGGYGDRGNRGDKGNGRYHHLHWNWDWHDGRV